MPQENQSKRIGKSPSPMINRVIANNKNVQQPVGTKPGNKQFNRQPVKP
jgi:hypothetical protein